MYAEIDRATFDAVWSGAADAVDVAAPRFLRSWHPEQESATARRFGLGDAVGVHELRAGDAGPGSVRGRAVEVAPRRRRWFPSRCRRRRARQTPRQTLPSLRSAQTGG